MKDKGAKRKLTSEEKLHIARKIRSLSEFMQELAIMDKKVNPFFFMMVAANLQKAVDDFRLGLEIETPPNVEY